MYVVCQYHVSFEEAMCSLSILDNTLCVSQLSKLIMVVTCCKIYDTVTCEHRNEINSELDCFLIVMCVILNYLG